MEIPPSSSFAQSSALFSGENKKDILRQLFLQGPVSDRNSHIESSNRFVATSCTGELQDFKIDDFKEAYRMMNGPPKYPFQDIALIENYKFDPYYFDGSENDPNINVNENLIGTPLGVSTLEDPRMSYVKNILTLKEYNGQANQLNDSYIKELYMVNSDKGSNYYYNMLERQKDSLDNWSREGRKRKNKAVPGIAFTYNLPTGTTNAVRKKRNVVQTLYSETPSVQRNYRREKFLSYGNNEDEVNTRNGARRNDRNDTFQEDDDIQSVDTFRSGANTEGTRTETSGVDLLNESVAFEGNSIIPSPSTLFFTPPKSEKPFMTGIRDLEYNISKLRKKINTPPVHLSEVYGTPGKGVSEPILAMDNPAINLNSASQAFIEATKKQNTPARARGERGVFTKKQNEQVTASWEDSATNLKKLLGQVEPTSQGYLIRQLLTDYDNGRLSDPDWRITKSTAVEEKARIYFARALDYTRRTQNQNKRDERSQIIEDILTV